jgi:hypothetical protein
VIRSMTKKLKRYQIRINIITIKAEYQWRVMNIMRTHPILECLTISTADESDLKAMIPILEIMKISELRLQLEGFCLFSEYGSKQFDLSGGKIMHKSVFLSLGVQNVHTMTISATADGLDLPKMPNTLRTLTLEGMFNRTDLTLEGLTTLTLVLGAENSRILYKKRGNMKNVEL